MFELDILFDDARLIWSEGDKEIRIYEYTKKELYAGKDMLRYQKDQKIKLKIRSNAEAITNLIECKQKKFTTSNLNNALETAKIIEAIEEFSITINYNLITG